MAVDCRGAGMPLTEATLAIRAQALALGFDLAGVARVEPLGPEFDHYERWVAAGRAGEMDYMTRNAPVRKNPAHSKLLDGARSVVCCAMTYARSGDPTAKPGATIARYARGRDYHNFLRKKLRKLAEFVRRLAPGTRARACVDTAPVLERAWAARAGLGWIGKNGCLIHPRLGSHLLLGEVVTDLELDADGPVAEQCGGCSACLSACPTDALVAPYEMDARRCISYLTIELRGPIDESLRRAMGEHLFGCDLCQDVCPFNHAAPGSPHPEFDPTAPVHGRTVAELVGLDEAAYRRLTAGTPLARPGRDAFVRNACVVLGNGPASPEAFVALRRAREDPSPLVREHAAWAERRMSR